jgi:hypothetical protein
MENFVPITPVNFFQIQTECYYLESDFSKLSGSKLKKYLLPNTSALCYETPFAEVGIGWNPKGIEVSAAMSQPFVRSNFPNIIQGDSLELFFDTRDVKTAGFNTRFCHHFYFLPTEIEGHSKGEITKFRTEDNHELCDAADLKLIPVLKKMSYTLQIFIPAHCFFGYDPEQFDRLGFAYRINRSSGRSQHFCVVSEDFQLEQQSSLWSTLKLVK